MVGIANITTYQLLNSSESPYLCKKKYPQNQKEGLGNNSFCLMELF